MLSSMSFNTKCSAGGRVHRYAAQRRLQRQCYGARWVSRQIILVHQAGIVTHYPPAAPCRHAPQRERDRPPNTTSAANVPPVSPARTERPDTPLDP